MSVEEIITELEVTAKMFDRIRRHQAETGKSGTANILRAAIALIREYQAFQSSDTSARLAAIKDIPTERLVELAVAEAAGLISILPSAAERAHQDAQPNEPLTLESLRGMEGQPVWVTHKDGSGGRWGIVNTYPSGICADVCSGQAYWFEDYVGTIAYRRPPKEA